MKYKFILIILSFILTLVFLKGTGVANFLFIHDEYLLLSKEEAARSVNVFKTVDFGVTNTNSAVVNFLTSAFYLLLLPLLSLHKIQFVSYFLKLLLITILPFVGFQKVSKLLAKGQSDLIIFVISLFYSFNTYTLVFWHGNGFDLTLMVCYSLAPLAFYYLHRSLFSDSSITTKTAAVILMFFMSFGLYLFAVFFLMMFLYVLLYTIFIYKNYLRVFKNLLLIVVLYLPFLSIFSLMLYEILRSSNAVLSMSGGETYAILRGEFLYPLLMWFSWGIYTYWSPRNIYTFYKYFYTPLSIIAPFIIYGIIVLSIIKDKSRKILLIFSSILLFMLVMVKGGQGILSGVYLFLINNVSLFRIFRSPDNKFGFGIILILCLLLLISTLDLRKKVVVPLIIFVVIVQGFLIFNGTAIRGENTLTSSDRIIHISKDYKSVAEFLNKSSDFGYIMSEPSLEFSKYNLGEKDSHLGQDLLPKIIRFPFSYTSLYSNMPITTYKKLSTAIGEANFEELSQFPIKFYLIRRDSEFLKPNKIFSSHIMSNNKLVFSNDLFDVYENTNFKPILTGEISSFLVVSPVKYVVSLSNSSSPSSLTFLQNYNSGWRLYIDRPTKLGMLENLSYIFRKPVYEGSHKITLGWANGWELPVQKDSKMVLFYLPQAYFDLCVYLSFTYLILLLTFVVVRKVRIQNK